MATLTLFRGLGYEIADYPVTFSLYENEITLPVYNGLTDAQVDEVIAVVSAAVESELGAGPDTPPSGAALDTSASPTLDPRGERE